MIDRPTTKLGIFSAHHGDRIHETAEEAVRKLKTIRSPERERAIARSAVRTIEDLLEVRAASRSQLARADISVRDLLAEKNALAQDAITYRLAVRAYLERIVSALKAAGEAEIPTAVTVAINDVGELLREVPHA